MSTAPQIIETTKLDNGLTEYQIVWPKYNVNMIQTTTKSRKEVLAEMEQQVEREEDLKRTAHKTFNRHKRTTNQIPMSKSTSNRRNQIRMDLGS